MYWTEWCVYDWTCQRHSYCTLSYLLWFWLLLVAAVCARSFALRLLLLHLMCVCQCCQLAFMLVVHTAVLTQYVRVSSYLDGTTTSSKQKRGDMKWHEQWPHRSGGARTKLYSTENSSSANRILRPRQKKNSWPNPWHQRRILYRFISIFLLGSLFFSDDTHIRTTEDQAYKRTVYLLLIDHSLTLMSILFLQVKLINEYQDC